MHIAETIKLASLGLEAFHPIFSPDGTKIAFSASSKEESCQIYIVNIDGSGLTRLTDKPSPNGVSRFSPDGTKIAYLSDHPTGEDDNNYDIYTMSLDGSNKQRLTYLGGTDPTFNNDGSLISFLSNDHIPYEISVMNSDGSNVKQLTHTHMDKASRTSPRFIRKPCFSPDGRWIYFLAILYSRDDSVREIHRINLDDSTIDQISHTNEDIVDYIISPDGKTIVLTSLYTDQKSGIMRSIVYTIGSDGSDQKQIMESNGMNWIGSFSPDSKWIVFCSNRDKKSTDVTRNWDIYLIRTDGSELVRLTDNDSLDTEPVFSPDGSMIAFSSDRDGNREIYLGYISY